jgi:hypothetical protein
MFSSLGSKSYSENGPVSSVVCYESFIVIVFDNGASVEISAEADCCSESWFSTLEYTSSSSEKMQELLSPLVGHVLEAITVVNHDLTQPADEIISEINREDYTELCSEITFRFADVLVQLVLFNSSNGYYTGWVEIKDGFNPERCRTNYVSTFRTLTSESMCSIIESYVEDIGTREYTVYTPSAPLSVGPGTGYNAPIGATGMTGCTAPIGATGSTGYNGPVNANGIATGPTGATGYNG